MADHLDQVIATFQKWLYLPNPDALLAVLGTVAANKLEGDPVWLMVVGPPGGGKSEVLQSVLGLKDTRPAATMTERALLSGTAKKEREEGAKGGLLKEIGNYGILVCKDFGSLLSMHREERARTMAALREIFDGSWTRHVGVDGGRTLHWQGKVGLVAGVTPTIDRHHGVMGAMGERFILIRLPVAARSAQARKALAHRGREREMRAELADVVSGLFERSLPAAPQLSSGEEERLISLASLVARCRSAVERDGSSREIELVPESEAPTRLIGQLDRLLAGLKVIGIDHERAWQVVTRVGLDSMPKLRYDVLRIIYDAAGEGLETGEIAKLVRHPTTTTRRALEDLTAHYIVERSRNGEGHADTWLLNDDAATELRFVLSGVPETSPPQPEQHNQHESEGHPTNREQPQETVPETSHHRTDHSGVSSSPRVGRQNGNGSERDPVAVQADPDELDWDI